MALMGLYPVKPFPTPGIGKPEAAVGGMDKKPPETICSLDEDRNIACSAKTPGWS